MNQAEPEEIFIGPMSPLRKLFLKNVKLLGSLRTTAAIRDTLLELVLTVTTAELFRNHPSRTEAGGAKAAST